MEEKAAIWDQSATTATMATPMLAMAVDDPELHYPFYHQRGRRRRRSPPPVPLSLTMTASQQMVHRPYHPPPRTRHNNPRPRQQTPSGSSGTFRGRRRHRSPSIGAASAMAAAAVAAVRKASSQSSRPHTRSSSVASSMQHVSRPSSPHEWWGTATTTPSATSNSGSWLCRSVSRSRGRQIRRGGAAGSSAAAAGRAVESPSPRRKMAYRRPMDMDHSAMMAHYHHHLLAPTLHKPYTKPVTRRSHCPSRSGSADGYRDDTSGSPTPSPVTADPIALAARRRRRRQRTQSRPRPRRMMSGDSVTGVGSSGLYELPGYYTFDNDNSMAHGDSIDDSGDTATASSRLQFQMLLEDSSDTTSDGDAMDMEMG
ncbi:hypothetical protein Sste5346_001349 [Sporothrix stenoceras]|uniref:Uncharacterized protein n=1 Tax=Sporothrix stenoceras TaxID=5173 RepID=A0ABR3ZQL2_9PEZI